MTLQKGIGYGTTIGYHTGIGSGSFTVIAEVVDQIENEVTGTEVSTTLLGDKYTSSVQSDIDSGELTFEIALDPANTNNQALATLKDNGNVATWQLTYSNDSGATKTETFTGWVKSLGRTIQKSKLLTRKVTIRLTGDAGIYKG